MTIDNSAEILVRDKLLKKLARKQHVTLTISIPKEGKGVTCSNEDHHRETEEELSHYLETSAVITAAKPRLPSSASTQLVSVTTQPTIPPSDGTNLYRNAPPAHYDGELALSVLQSSSLVPYVGNKAMKSRRWYEEEERMWHYSSSTFENRLKRKLAESRDRRPRYIM